MNDPVSIYSRSRAGWRAFHLSTCEGHHAARLRRFREVSASKLGDTLGLLPAGEREPVAFGIYLGAASGWNAEERERFRRHHLSRCHPAAAEVLDGADRGTLAAPGRVPATLEEFPSRIWKRALASGRPGRLATAGAQAVEAIVRLLESHPDRGCGLPFYPTQRRMVPSVPIREAAPDYPHPDHWLGVTVGDMPSELDLIAVAPASSLHLKGRMFDHFTALGQSIGFTILKPTAKAIFSWFQGATQNVMPDAYFADCEKRVANLRESRSPFRHPDAEVTVAGAIAYRLGRRRLAARFDPLPDPGLRRRHGWHHLPIPPERHARLRRVLATQAGADATAWQTDPGLACSGMSLPLWLEDGSDHLPKIAALLERTGEFPWVFPRLYHVFQWRLALAGHCDALRGIYERFPDDSWGLDRPDSDMFRFLFDPASPPR